MTGDHTIEAKCFHFALADGTEAVALLLPEPTEEPEKQKLEHRLLLRRYIDIPFALIYRKGDGWEIRGEPSVTEPISELTISDQEIRTLVLTPLPKS